MGRPPEADGLQDFFDGWALWQEHRPQSAEDWINVAERCVADGFDESVSSPLFAAVVKQTRRLVAAGETESPPEGTKP